MCSSLHELVFFSHPPTIGRGRGLMIDNGLDGPPFTFRGAIARSRKLFF